MGEGTPPPELTDVTLVLADLDPAVGADHLRAWTDRVIVVVTAGRSSAEKVRTVADLIRSAGLDLRFAVLMHTERSDNSSGTGTSSDRPPFSFARTRIVSRAESDTTEVRGSMSTLALTPKSALAGQTGATGLIRSPLPAWAALFLNILAFAGLPTVIPIPTTVGQMVTQGALIAALLLAFLANPRGVIRPNLFLVLLTMLGVVALMVSIHNEFMLGSTFRACRLLGFTAVLWLLTPWWGRSDFALLRPTSRACASCSCTVLVGAVVAPGESVLLRWPALWARRGRSRPRRWPTTQPSYSGAPSCCGSLEPSAVEPPC